jgi:excisionase family DNA binding protein
MNGKHEWLTPAQAAEYLGVTERQTRRWAQAGKLPHTKMGLRLQFSREQLDAFVAASSKGGVA